jgi:glycosyltransferase involved in cell wall biosynthesis
MNVVVVTVAHRGDDARIVHRQIRSLLEAEHSVTLVAPDPGESRSQDPKGLERIVIRRAVGRRRLLAWWEARRAARRFAGIADVILVHDPELVPVLAIGRWKRAALVWDVHEDFVASVSDRAWLPRAARPFVRRILVVLEKVAQKRFQVILAEDSYTSRFPHAPVVPNSTWVLGDPADLDLSSPRVVYVGRLSRSRGVSSLVALGEELVRLGGPRLVLVGPADADVAAVLDDAVRRDVLDWHGPLPNPEALAVVRGAVAGLSLLSNHANYVHSRPTKVIEYMAQGTPAITTPLPLAVEMVQASGAGVVTSSWFGPDLVSEVADAVMAYASSPALRSEHGRQSWEYLRANLSWNSDGSRFVGLKEGFSATSRR